MVLSSPRKSAQRVSTPNHKSFAFTLIELLVVISIIAILASISVPVLGKMQENGRTTKCANNLRQIGVAMFSYAGENDGEFPTSAGTVYYHAVDPQTNLPGWTEQLEKYLGTDRS